MDWGADSDFETSFLADLLIGAVTGIVAIFSGPAAVIVLVSLEVANEVAEEHVRAEEPTSAQRLADNLVNRPKFRTAEDGRIELL